MVVFLVVVFFLVVVVRLVVVVVGLVVVRLVVVVVGLVVVRLVVVVVGLVVVVVVVVVCPGARHVSLYFVLNPVSNCVAIAVLLMNVSISEQKSSTDESTVNPT